MINSYQIYKDIIDKYMYELSFNAFKIVVELYIRTIYEDSWISFLELTSIVKLEGKELDDALVEVFEANLLDYLESEEKMALFRIKANRNREPLPSIPPKVFFQRFGKGEMSTKVHKSKSAIKRFRVQIKLRNEVLTRDCYKCVYCKSTDNLSIDHIIPVSQGGNNHISNLQTLCRSCNSMKGRK
jgi:hypothetical protein